MDSSKRTRGQHLNHGAAYVRSLAAAGCRFVTELFSLDTAVIAVAFAALSELTNGEGVALAVRLAELIQAVADPLRQR